MNVLILAAGYATRLYPLTRDKAKPLLVVGGKPIIEWLVDNLAGIPDLETIYVVTNDKFAADFQAWGQSYQKRHPEFNFKIVNDGSTSDGDKLGAIGDINFVVTQESLSHSSLLIAAGDNLFTESLADFVATAINSEVTVAVYDVGDIEAVKKYGNVAVDAEGIMTRFEEKPKKTTGNARSDCPVLLLACGSLAVANVSGCREQCGSARPLCAVALHPEAGEHVPDQRPMARHRKQGNPRERGRNFTSTALNRESLADS